MKKEDYDVIRNLLVSDLTNARSASCGPRVQEITARIKRLDEDQGTTGKKEKLMEREVKDGKG